MTNASTLTFKRGSRAQRWWAAIFATLVLLGLLTACGGGGNNSVSSVPDPVIPPVNVDIKDALIATKGITSVNEQASSIEGTRFFSFVLSQPVDHNAPNGTQFSQRLTLLYRAKSAPMVLATTGYAISGTPYQGEVSSLLKGNELQMEHRFFNSSTPTVKDWSKLDIWQAANDEHRVVQALKPLFSAKWVNTGASKGGMTAIFHRRFFPTDVDATIAYVAPISFAASDPRYPAFEKTRGTPAIRAAIEEWQQAMLDRRSEMRSLLEQDFASKKASFKYLGLDKTLEFAILEAPFTLWQYGNANLAAQVPNKNAPAAELYRFLDSASFGVVKTWSDETLDYYQAYYYQTATQLGYPLIADDYLRGLLYLGQDTGAAYPPYGVNAKYDGSAMLDIQNWVNDSATRLMLIYGENDPWTAGAFQLSSAASARDNHKYLVPNGNHGAKISQLPADQKALALAKISSWIGVPISVAPTEKVTIGRKDLLQRH